MTTPVIRKQSSRYRTEENAGATPSVECLNLIEAARSTGPETAICLAYDGSIEGLLTCIFVSYACHRTIEDIRNGMFVQPRLSQRIIAVKTDMNAAWRVRGGILRMCGRDVWHTVMAACASDNPETGNIIHRFVHHALDNGRSKRCGACLKQSTCRYPCSHMKTRSILDDWVSPEIGSVLELHRQVENEIEKIRQFIRFEHVEGDLWFAQCNPRCSCIPLCMDWFAKRFNTQRFAIYDENHGIVGISEGGSYQIARVDSIAPPPHTAEEQGMQAAWKRFYDSLTIDARYNPELRRHFMPVRFWSNLTEMQP